MLFLIGAMVVYRIGTFIPVPGINPAQVARFFSQNSGTIFGIANLFSGGALSRMSIFAMNVMPYISASIIIQMMSMVVPTLMELRKEGQAGQRKITEYTRYGSLILAVVQSFAAAGALVKGGMTLVSGPQFLLVGHDHHDHRHHVPDVARRADHRARHRQRHLDDHSRRHRGAAAVGDRRHGRSR